MAKEPNETETTRIRRRVWWTSPFLLASIALHLLFAAGAASWVVAHYSATRKLTFKAGPKSPNPGERALQHRVQMQQKTETLPLAAVPKRVLSTGLSKVALPAMPDLPKPNATVASPKMSAAAGSFAAGAAPMGASFGGTGSGAPINFFGIRDTSTSVVILIDVSDSMFTRTGDAKGSKLNKLGAEQSFQTIRDEAIKLVQSLTPATRFGIVRWSGAAYSWKPELVPATEANKQEAINHIQSDVDFHTAKKKPNRPGGTRHDYALEEAFRLKPETIYMITDGNATGESTRDPSRKISPEDIYQVANEGQTGLPKRARVHVIYYLTGGEKAAEREMLSTLATNNGGRFQVVPARTSR